MLFYNQNVVENVKLPQNIPQINIWHVPDKDATYANIGFLQLKRLLMYSI